MRVSRYKNLPLDITLLLLQIFYLKFLRNISTWRKVINFLTSEVRFYLRRWKILERSRLSWLAIPLHWRLFRLFRLSRFLEPQEVSSSNTTALDVSRDRISHYFNSYGNHAAQPLRRLAENFRDNARDNAGEGREVRRRGWQGGTGIQRWLQRVP